MLNLVLMKMSEERGRARYIYTDWLVCGV